MATPLTDAITSLTTYANGITGKSDTNLPDAVRSLADGYGASGGVKTASGTFTVSDNYITSKQIVHNLGTTRLFGMVWKEADANDQIVAARGYDLVFGHFITHSFVNDLYSGKTIVTNYTSSSTKTAAHTDETNPYLRRYKSNWTNKAASWTADTSNVVNQVWGNAVDNNTINIKTNSSNTYMGLGTYHWQVWALDDWVND